MKGAPARKDPVFSILIVEDVAEMRGLLENLVQGIPEFRVSGLARNGFETRLEVSRRRPDLVLLDEILPGESSVDLLKDLAADQIPVLLITGSTHLPVHLPLGAVGRVVKPGWDSLAEDRDRLKTLIFRVLKRSEA